MAVRKNMDTMHLGDFDKKMDGIFRELFPDQTCHNIGIKKFSS